MPNLKLGPILDDKPIKVSLELPAKLHRDLGLYARILGQQSGGADFDPVRLIVPMLERFIASDRSFSAARRSRPQKEGEDPARPTR